MDHRSWHLALFCCLSLLSGSGLGTAKAFRNDLGRQLDDVPIVNPITPGTGNPYLNPTTPQPPDTIGQTPTTPYITPTTPTPTTPTTPTQTTPGTTGGQWCVATQGSSDTALQTALDYACGYGGADCSAVQPGASCYQPNTLRDHASYAFNSYYHKNPIPTSCDFGGTATLTSTDPSSGNCKYDAGSSSPKTTSMSPPVYVSPPSPVTITPTVPTPPDTTMYGSEPAESPNTASSAFNSLLLLFACGLLASLQLANCISNIPM